jgi:hypothetical protein
MTTELKPKVETLVIDDQSPPGAWKDEMKAAPWGYGQSQQMLVERSLENIRRAGLSDEATVLTLELLTLRNELEYLSGKVRKP